jgi:hypothetical protein
MSLNFDDLNIGGQLKVGTGIVPAVKEGDEKINGSMYAEGPVVFGGPTEFGENEATLMVGRTKNSDDDCEPADQSVHIRGNQRIDGDDGTANALYVTGGGTVDSLYVDGDVYVTGKVDCDNKGRLASRFSSADARPKPFDIKHPSREGYRLRYACVEGPEVGVYHRGRVKNEKVIILPSYWKDFVYIDSISVQLQPIGAHQDVIVKRWDDEKIYLQSKGGMPIDCFYHVYAERNDINPLITEYEGESCEDYPDPNHHKISEDERNYKDLKYATEQNIRTK